MNLIHQNYIKESGNGLNFNIEVSSIPYKDTDYFKESKLAAQIIESNKTGNLYLMYSGGVDSEYALNIFLILGIPITPVIVKLLPNYNNHDVDYAFKFCKSKNLNPLVIDIDYDKFITSGKMLSLALDMRSSLPHYTTTAHAILQLDGTVICGDGEPYIKKDGEEWNIHIYEYDYSLPNLYLNKNINGVVHFNRYTPQMFRTFLLDQRLKDLANNLIYGKLGSHSSKYIIYNRFSEFKLEERKKFHGLEIIEKSSIYNHESFKELHKIGQTWNGDYSINYLKFIKTFV